jgi:hypothetical protein
VFNLSSAVTQGGPAVILILVTVGMAAWAALASGVLRFGREVDYRDQIIGQQAKTIEEQRETIAQQAQANLQQAAASELALSLIRNDLLPRLARASGV